ncbi:hypothetical protein AQUCO_02400093v1 [Aquilegia coerulea]|uniref:F-box domain-containing protein n=1 Tax=Aquilegia coerulea TaxID=218851 RepID=A0A2G5DBB0_AQUCA|nr:hypothetical protein AQUCO_02400093v1 [Aquilegia coerulea]
MGSLPTPPPSPQQENSAIEHLVFAVFCARDRYPNVNMSNWLASYRPSTNSWRRIGPIPELRENHVLKGFSMVSILDSIYIIGGRLCLKEGGHGYGGDTDDIVEVDIEVLPMVTRYNVRTNEWSRCAPLGTPRVDFACTVCDNKIYVAGGQSTLGSVRGTTSAEMYDPTLNEWTPLPNMSTSRYKCVGVAWQGKIHVVGGFTEKGDCDSMAAVSIYAPERSSAEVFDTSRDRWDLMARMWQLDVPPNQIVPVNGRLFSSGDCLNAWKGHIEAYDGKLNIWNMVDGSHLQSMSSPTSTSDPNNCTNQRLYLTMAPIGTYLYFLAGYRMHGELVRSMSVVHRFDTSANGDPWRSFEPMEEEGDKELCSHCCVVQVSV